MRGVSVLYLLRLIFLDLSQSSGADIQRTHTHYSHITTTIPYQLGGVYSPATAEARTYYLSSIFLDLYQRQYWPWRESIQSAILLYWLLFAFIWARTIRFSLLRFVSTMIPDL
ncbi:hypothetical protein BJ138DRAFT_1167429, partial [Hygrophoropsis aurantiaca]